LADVEESEIEPAIAKIVGQRDLNICLTETCFNHHNQVLHESRSLMSKPEIYISTDVEADGPIPGPHSMLSFASAAYRADKTLVSTFAANLETLPGAEGHPATMKWWQGQQEAWKACRIDLQPPEQAMKNYVQWLKSLDGLPVFVAYPAGFDFMFIYWYLMRFVGESPFSHSALDLKTYAMALLKMDYRKCTKHTMPKDWFDELPHTHVALDDAIEQGALFCNMLKENRR
jgi:hypothetical protein